VQNHVHELWAVFDFLMPNFLGSSVFFSEKYARTISKGQAPSASVREISEGIEKLKTLHQQVLPFILRREKQQVLRELPSKLVTQIEVPMSDLQRRLYTDFCSFADVQQSLRALDRAAKDDLGDRCLEQAGRSSLQALLFLRLLSTHPWLVRSAIPVASEISDNDWLRFDTSGKIRALADLLRELSIFTDDLSAADNDSSLLYCEDDHVDVDVYSSLVNSSDNQMQPAPTSSEVQSQTKCLIFAQFIQSLDVVEKLLFKPHIPSLKYLRLDGRVPARRRYAIAEEFNRNDEIKVLLLTTRVGGLGLSLTGADTVIFLEHDFNPFADLQGMQQLRDMEIFA
jgi:TATA-binding protein-associated factor